jgi:hypothetical protein
MHGRVSVGIAHCFTVSLDGVPVKTFGSFGEVEAYIDDLEHMFETVAMTKTGHVVGATYRSANGGHTYRVLGPDPVHGGALVQQLDDPRNPDENGRIRTHCSDRGNDERVG